MRLFFNICWQNSLLILFLLHQLKITWCLPGNINNLSCHFLFRVIRNFDSLSAVFPLITDSCFFLNSLPCFNYSITFLLSQVYLCVSFSVTVCLSVCTWFCMSLCVLFTCVCLCVCLRMYAETCLSAVACVFMHICVCVCSRVSLCLYVYFSLGVRISRSLCVCNCGFMCFFCVSVSPHVSLFVCFSRCVSASALLSLWICISVFVHDRVLLCVYLRSCVSECICICFFVQLYSCSSYCVCAECILMSVEWLCIYMY